MPIGELRRFLYTEGGVGVDIPSGAMQLLHRVGVDGQLLWRL